MKFKGVCINDFLFKGPSMWNSLVGVLIRFQTYMHAIISDIRKLYYQCIVKKSQQDFLHFLSYKDNDFTQPIVKNKMTRLSFGLLPAQSATLHCFEQTIFDNVMQASVATIITALKNFYIDDELFNFPNDTELISFFKQIVPMLALRDFPLTSFYDVRWIKKK